MDVLREGDGGLPDGVAEDYCYKGELMYPLPTDPPSVERIDIIVTTPARWAARPESSDPGWEIMPNAMPLVVAARTCR
jgi:hypothetical protein